MVREQHKKAPRQKKKSKYVEVETQSKATEAAEKDMRTQKTQQASTSKVGKHGDTDASV